MLKQMQQQKLDQMLDWIVELVQWNDLWVCFCLPVCCFYYRYHTIMTLVIIVFIRSEKVVAPVSLSPASPVCSDWLRSLIDMDPSLSLLRTSLSKGNKVHPLDVVLHRWW